MDLISGATFLVSGQRPIVLSTRNPAQPIGTYVAYFPSDCAPTPPWQRDGPYSRHLMYCRIPNCPSESMARDVSNRFPNVRENSCASESDSKGWALGPLVPFEPFARWALGPLAPWALGPLGPLGPGGPLVPFGPAHPEQRQWQDLSPDVTKSCSIDDAPPALSSITCRISSLTYPNHAPPQAAPVAWMRSRRKQKRHTQDQHEVKYSTRLLRVANFRRKPTPV